MTPAPNSAVLDSPVNTPVNSRGAEEAVEADAAVLEELLVEEISIDGMCGVY